LCSFEGEILKYNYKEKKIKVEKHVKNLIAKEKYDNIIANPGYVSKCIYKEDEVYIGLLNGVILCLRYSNLKKKNLKTIHNAMISDMKLCWFNEDFMVTSGKDKKIKLINCASDMDVKYFIDVDETHAIETSKDNKIFYIDSSNNIKIINLKI
jgi:hypothetical protein